MHPVVGASIIPDRFHVSIQVTIGNNPANISTQTVLGPNVDLKQLNFKNILNGDFHVLGSGVFGAVYLVTCLDGAVDW